MQLFWKTNIGRQYPFKSYTVLSMCRTWMYLCKIYIVHVCEIFIKPFLTELIDQSTYMYITEAHWILIIVSSHLSIFLFIR
jgi:hypothetical protein